MHPKWVVRIFLSPPKAELTASQGVCVGEEGTELSLTHRSMYIKTEQLKPANASPQVTKGQVAPCSSLPSFPSPGLNQVV